MTVQNRLSRVLSEEVIDGFTLQSHCRPRQTAVVGAASLRVEVSQMFHLNIVNSCLITSLKKQRKKTRGLKERNSLRRKGHAMGLALGPWYFYCWYIC